ncbi:MAG TPA: PP2C family protein-serine/threonine phosphatase [Candidatus Polarisedimenticolia bacterium]|nr:PP2C family protein-serine/threonine phosphatase [Candidatus Polarisedimenticolia bacterium]
MTEQSDRSTGRPAGRSGFGAIFRDVHARELPGSLRRDVSDLYRFYLDDETRAQLAGMGRIRRGFKMVFWTFSSLLLKLSPLRRVMLLAALLLLLLGRVSLVVVGPIILTPTIRLWLAVLLLLVVLMLELKDKLLARDEIELARQVQLALLPRSHPHPAGWAIWSHTRPANEVGGDLVDSLALPSGEVGVALGDVAGKGLAAALLMAKLQATLRALAPDIGSLGDLGAALNQILCRDGLENRFATLFYFTLRPGSPAVRYLNAGHNPPYVVRDGEVEQLDPSARPLGMLPGGAYRENRVDLAPGDLLIVYSDGLVEARNAQGEEFGNDRLLALARGLRGLPAEQCGARLVQAADRFLGEERPHDDLSLLVVERLPPAG